MKKPADYAHSIGNPGVLGSVGSYLVMALLGSAVASPQAPVPVNKFEVASVKPVTSDRGNYYFVMRGGPGTNTPTQFTCESATLGKLLMRAYGIKSYQLQGPSWLDSNKYDILAKIRPGASEQEFKQMLQNLLIERFGAAIDRVQKDMPIYALLVAKNGHKLTPSSADQESSSQHRESAIETPSGSSGGPATHSKTHLDANGYPENAELPDGRAVLGILNGKAKLATRKESMESLAKRLEFHLERPVVDLTGLQGNYAFTLFWVVESASGRNGTPKNPGDPGGPAVMAGPTVFEALRTQLGLELQPRKGPVEVLVVRHIERTPTEN